MRTYGGEIVAKNTHSTDGLAEDLIRSFVQLAVVEMHLKSLIEKSESKFDSGEIDVEDSDAVLEVMQDVVGLEEELTEVASLRRADMLYLYKLYEGKGDKTMWCMVKHYAIAMMTAFEVYQASEDDTEAYTAFIAKNKLFTKALSKFLGVGITECAACFADMLKGESNGS